MSGAGPDADLVVEARRIQDRAAASGLAVRVLGGVGVALHDHGPVPASLQRSYGDIDIVVPAKGARATGDVLRALGYTPNERFNALHSARRMLFYDNENQRQLDVFVGLFAMCHELDLGRRLDQHPDLLDPADLLLTKLQIAQINQKDVVDGVRLFHLHEVGEDQVPPPATDVISLKRLVEVTSGDWGWYTTFTDNLDRLSQAAPELLSGDDGVRVTDRIDRVRTALAAAPKSMRWRARNAIGRKVPWYELPEEVDRGAAR